MCATSGEDYVQTSIPLRLFIVHMSCDASDGTAQPEKTKNQLHSLTDSFSLHSKMAAANVPLEYLQVRGSVASREFADSVSNIKTLKTLKLVRIDNLQMSHLHEICENSPHLSHLVVDDCSDFSVTGLLKLIRKAPKLQEIGLSFAHVHFDDDSFKALVKIVEKRAQTRPLKIFAPNSLLDVSKKIIEMNKDKLIFGSRNPINYISDDEDEDDDEYYDEDDDLDTDDDLYHGSDIDIFDTDDDDEWGIFNNGQLMNLDRLVGFAHFFRHH